MGLTLTSGEVDRLARELAALTGESLDTAVATALAERLERYKRTRDLARREALREIRERVSRLPVLDRRSDDELLGYDENGTFG